MLFGVKLANEVYPPWADSYINYERLKKLLKESSLKLNKSKENWSDKDESAFVAALDSELEKVYTFQTEKYNSVSSKIEELQKQTEEEDLIKAIDWTAFQKELEECLSEAQELDNFSRLNFTGFTKIVKKHDRLHPKYNSVKALLQVRLQELPFHSEDYSPLLYNISFLYNILRSNFANSSSLNSAKLSSVTQQEDMTYQTFKFWIHPENLMEVKTSILRHLPVLVYAQTPRADDDLIERISGDDITIQNGGFDPVISALYFDNENLELYNNKLEKNNAAPTLRLRWTGKLEDEPPIFLEKRTYDHDLASGKHDSEETRIKLKEKYINQFLFGEDKTKLLKKLKEKAKDQNDVDDLQQYILEHNLQPTLRTVYSRTAFQIPGDDRVRVTIDSDILYIREDAFDEDRPIRQANKWHREDIDSGNKKLSTFLRKGEFSKFPFSVMEIKVKSHGNEAGHVNLPFSKKHGKWIEELTSSHLVKEVPKFSKYVQGVASLFSEDDRLDALPFWLPEVEHDIRRDPKKAYEEEKAKLQQRQEVQATQSKIRRLSLIPGVTQQTTTARVPTEVPVVSEPADEYEENESSDEEPAVQRRREEPTFFSVLTGTHSKLNNVDSEDEEIVLPPGVHKPSSLIKNAGPVNVEAKVWLANERTFNKWLSVTTLLSILTFSIYNSVNSANMPGLATNLAYVYFALTIFTGVWAYRTYLDRLNTIKERSGKHLDAPLGPLIVAFVVTSALVFNFVATFKHAASTRPVQELEDVSGFHSTVQNVVFWAVGAETM